MPGGIKRRKLTRALEKLGFEISTRGGNGSHFKATHIQSQKCVIIQEDLRKDVLHYVLKQIEEISGVTWDDISNML